MSSVTGRATDGQYQYHCETQAVPVAGDCGYRAEDRAERLALVACLLAVIPALNLATSDAAAAAGLVMTVLTVGLVSCTGKSLPRFWPGDFFPTFYACHLAVLGVLAL